MSAKFFICERKESNIMYYFFFNFFNFINDQGRQHKIPKRRLVAHGYLQIICVINFCMCKRKVSNFSRIKMQYVFHYLREIQNLLFSLCYHIILSYSTTIYDINVRMEVASSRADHLPTLSITKTSELSLLVNSTLEAGRPMPALLLRLLHQCVGDIEMNPGPVSTPTPTICLRLTQWNTNGIC